MNPRPQVDTKGMTNLPLSGSSLAPRLLTEGIPPSLLIDLLDPVGMRLALAQELLAGDVASTALPALVAGQQPARSIGVARTA